ncbi:MAG: dephospho-CoA kinase [Bacteroidota bacterium]
MKQPLKIGITGGIGSGKSFICKIFEQLSYEVYYADTQAKSLMLTDPVLIKGVKNLLGEEAYFKDGSLNRMYVGGIVFQDEAKLQALNALVHPAVGRDFLQWYLHIKPDYPHQFVLKEAAILYESGSYKESDGVITVYAPKEIRIERVLSREKTNREAILARMAKQWPESEKRKRADFTIINDGKQHLLPQIKSAIEFFNAYGF